MKEFTGCYQVAETLTFELRPQGKTAEMLQKSGLLEQDQKRADAYPEVKQFLDERHKELLQRALSDVRLDWHELAATLKAYQEGRAEKKELEKCQQKYRKALVEKIKAHEMYSDLVEESTPSKIFKRFTEHDDLKTFASFACYFKGYQENRKNIYSDEAQQTSAAHRAVNENFARFLKAVQIYELIQDKNPDLLPEITAKAAEHLAGETLAAIFTVDSYDRFLPQSGIDFFNAVLGDINYAVNQYRQQHPEIPAREMPFMPPLFKQILSDRERTFSVGGFQ